MSKNRNRAKFNKAQNGREYRIEVLEEKYPIYWDEGQMFYPVYRRGYANSNKQLRRFQMRAYRTWKHNRKTQWKSNGKYQ